MFGQKTISNRNLKFELGAYPERARLHRPAEAALYWSIVEARNKRLIKVNNVLIPALEEIYYFTLQL